MSKIKYQNQAFGVIFLFLLGMRVYAQTLAAVSGSFNTRLSTGTNATNNGAVPIGSIDPHWTCNSGQTRVVAQPGICSWSSGFNNSSPYGNWISPSQTLCSGQPVGYFGCAQSGLYKYENTFSLPPKSAFAVYMQIFASGWVEEIWVNNVLAYKRNGSFSNPPNNQNSGLNFNWCKDWNLVGTNKISILVAAVSITPGICNYTGLRVISWPTNPNTYPSISGNTLVCPGSTNTYSVPTLASLGYASPPYSYSWTKPSGGWGGPTSTTNTLSAIAGTNSGVIYAMINGPTNNITVANCAAVAGISVSIPPSLTVTPSQTIICHGNSVYLSALGAVNYSWYASPNNTIPFAQFVSGVNVSPNVNTTYTVKGYTPLGNCLYAKTASITIKPSPSALIAFSPTNGIVCQGSSISLFGSSNMPHVNYLWAPGGSTSSAVSFAPTSNTTYTMWVTAPNGCVTSSMVSFTTAPSPTISIVASPPVICGGESSTLTASGGSQYIWSPGFSTVNPIVVSPTGPPGIYSVIGYTTNNCSMTASVQVKVLNTPTVVALPPVVCSGIQNTLTANGASSYTWTVGTGTNQVVHSNTASIILNLTSAMPYTVCGTAPQSGSCISCYTNTIPMGSSIPLSVSSVTLCKNAGPCTNISATSTLGVAMNYTWSPGPLPGTSSLMVCPNVNTTYTVNVASAGTLGCPSSATLAVHVETNCCSQPTAGMLSLDAANGLGGNFLNNSYVLSSNITLTASATFSNAEVWITPNVQITVPSGFQLELDKTHLFACGLNMWKGIVIQDGGRIITTPNHSQSYNSLIEDAEIAIDLSNITVLNSSPNPPIDIQGLIFNRNFIGIRISDSDFALDSLALGINGCVFSSRSLTYTTFQNLPLNWPNSTTNCGTGGLRCAVNPTSGLAPPYTMPGFPQSNLKLPHNTQPGHIGIQILNIGNPYNGGINSYSLIGIQTGITYPGPFVNDFNLFDGLGVGIEVTNASLITYKNVFQNMQRYNYPTGSINNYYGGQGIKHCVEPHLYMNTRLYLTGQNTSEGNQFYNCITGLQSFNVSDIWIRYSIFRSTHNIGMLANFHPTIGDTGISIISNRISYHSVLGSEFNNLKNGIVVSTPTANFDYDISGNGPTQGVVVGMCSIERNYFGALVNSSVPYSSGGANVSSSEYMEEAVHLSTPNTNNWHTWPIGTGNVIVVSNKIDRVFRGVYFDGFEDTKSMIAANDIFIEDDYTFGNPAFGYGICTSNHADGLSITNNTLNAQPWFLLAPNNPTVSLVYTKEHFGNNSPRIECNATSNSYYGFQFEGRSSGTIWEGNEMCTHFAGMALTNSAIIGPQGDPVNGLGSGNVWLITANCPQFGFNLQAPNHTYVEDSDPTLSFLYVFNSLDRDPTVNTSNNFSVPFYAVGPSIDNTAPSNRLADCVPAHGYPPTPNWKMNHSTANAELVQYEFKGSVKIYPNPTNGLLTIENQSTETISAISIVDVNGKEVHRMEINGSYKSNINLETLKPGVYIIVIKFIDGKIIHKKLIKSN